MLWEKVRRVVCTWRPERSREGRVRRRAKEDELEVRECCWGVQCWWNKNKERSETKQRSEDAGRLRRQRWTAKRRVLWRRWRCSLLWATRGRKKNGGANPSNKPTWPAEHSEEHKVKLWGERGLRQRVIMKLVRKASPTDLSSEDGLLE